LFDKLIRACKLPCDLILRIFGSEIIVDIHGGVADILFFHEMFGVEGDGEDG
jgi:hypothetical protein